MQTAINVGTVVDEASLQAVTDALLRLMDAKADQATIVASFQILMKIASINNITIQNCHIVGDRKVEVKIDADEGTAEVSQPTVGINVT